MALATSIVGGMIGKAVAGQSAADAAGKAAVAQEAEARYQQQRLEQAAEPNAQELAAIDKQIQTTDKALARQEQLLNAVDPALIEAGKQALSLIKGESSGATAPLERARQRQREQLQNRLREQLGPGFETSSAGIEALGRFDQDTADSVQGAQQQALGGITNFLASSSKFRPDVAQMAQISSLPVSSFQNIANRRTAAVGQAAGLSKLAGAQYVGAQKSAENVADTFGEIASFGKELAGTAIGAASTMATGGATGAAKKK